MFWHSFKFFMAASFHQMKICFLGCIFAALLLCAMRSNNSAIKVLQMELLYIYCASFDIHYLKIQPVISGIFGVSAWIWNMVMSVCTMCTCCTTRILFWVEEERFVCWAAEVPPAHPSVCFCTCLYAVFMSLINPYTTHFPIYRKVSILNLKRVISISLQA